MEERFSLWRGMRPLVGTVIGVGFFGLPYVFAQGGYLLVFVELVVLIVVQILFLRAYADLVLVKKGHVRFLHIIGDAFGPLGKMLTALSFFGTLWGAMIAYLLSGGDFLSYLLRPWIPQIASHDLSIIFGGFLFLALLGGGLLVQRISRYLIPFSFLVIFVLVLFSLPVVTPSHLLSFSWDHWVMPLGVLLFSLSGISAIPEMRDALRGNGAQLRKAIFLSMVLVGGIYALFSAVVVGITGAGTPEQAIAAFAGVAPWMVLLGSVLGISLFITAYMNIGSALLHTCLYDFRLRFLPSFALVGGVPFLAVLFGAQNVIGVLQYTGGVLSSLLGILVLLAYEKARRSGQFSAHTRALAPVLVFGVFAVFFVMLVMTLRG